MTIKLKEVVREQMNSRVHYDGPSWRTRDIFVNPEHVIMIRQVPAEEAGQINESLKQSAIPNLSVVSLNRGTSGLDIVVVGSVNEINKALTEERKVLHG